VTSVLSTGAIVALVALAAWMLGSFVLRWGGAFLGLMSLVGLATNGDPLMFWRLIPAAIFWVAGHWLYARRHGVYKSMLAATLLERLAGRGRPQAF
jgi:hypothetical protein